MNPRVSLQSAPEIIPIFPLPGALLLPGGRLPLNIFEPRYLAMTEDALKTDHRLIGMIQPRDSDAQENDGVLYEIGCAGRIVTFSEADDGRYLIALHGIARFRVSEEIQGFQPYRRVDVSWSEFAADFKRDTSDDPGFEKKPFLALVSDYCRAKSLDTDWDALGEANEETIVNALCMMCPFTPGEKQSLLEAKNLSERRQALETLLKIDAASGEYPLGGLQ